MSKRSMIVENALVWGSRAEYNFTTLETYIVGLENKNEQLEKYVENLQDVIYWLDPSTGNIDRLIKIVQKERKLDEIEEQ